MSEIHKRSIFTLICGKSGEFYFCVHWHWNLKAGVNWTQYRWKMVCVHGSIILTWPSCQIRKIAGAHAPDMPGTFSPSPQVSDPGMHHGTCVTRVPWCMPGSLTNGFLWNRRRGKRSRHSRRMRNLQFCVSGKMPMDLLLKKAQYK